MKQKKVLHSFQPELKHKGKQSETKLTSHTASMKNYTLRNLAASFCLLLYLTLGTPASAQRFTYIANDGTTELIVAPSDFNNGSVISALIEGEYHAIGFTDCRIQDLNSLDLSFISLPSGNGSATQASAKSSDTSDLDEWTIEYGPEISPLIKTSWSQVAPFNLYCPEFNGENAPTGCVATAMAQIIKYFEAPTHFAPVSRPDYFTLPDTDFDFASMLPLYAPGASTAQNDEAVGKLMYYCAESVATNYGLSASTSEVKKACQAMNSLFGYTSGRNITRKFRRMSDYEWGLLLYNHLDNDIPVHYAGGSHAFICDGYLEGAMFHFNMGKAGYTSGYYDFRYIKSDIVSHTVAVEMVINQTYLPELSDSYANFGTPVVPMLKSEWNQSKRYGKEFLTYDENGNNGTKVYGTIGTAPVSMAQICLYFNYPEYIDFREETIGAGPWSGKYIDDVFPYTFAYGIMPQGMSGSTNATAEAGTLRSCCAAAIDLHSDVDHSWADVDTICFAMKQAFGYSNAHVIDRKDFESWEAWAEVIYNEVAVGRPVLYSSTDDFLKHNYVSVIDGYDDGWNFHFNLGREDAENGFYDIRRPVGHFAMVKAIIGIEPPGETGLDNLISDSSNYNAESWQVYSLSGYMVGSFPSEKAATSTLSPGLYILRNGSSVKKVQLR